MRKKFDLSYCVNFFKTKKEQRADAPMTSPDPAPAAVERTSGISAPPIAMTEEVIAVKADKVDATEITL